MGAAWRNPPKKDFPKILEMIKAVKSLGLEKLPQIIPDAIDESTGFIDKETKLLRNYDFEKLLDNARRG